LDGAAAAQITEHVQLSTQQLTGGGDAQIAAGVRRKGDKLLIFQTTIHIEERTSQGH
jgi:hypothetical protein